MTILAYSIWKIFSAIFWDNQWILGTEKWELFMLFPELKRTLRRGTSLISPDTQMIQVFLLRGKEKLGEQVGT